MQNNNHQHGNTVDSVKSLTGLVGGDGDRHALGHTRAAGLRDSVACVDDEGVAGVGPQLAHHHLGGLEACLARRKDHVRAAGQAQLGAQTRIRAWSRLIIPLEYTPVCLDPSSHNALVRLRPRAGVLSLQLGDTAVVRRLSAYAVAARLTDETLQTVAGVASASEAAGRGPLQHHRGLVDHRDELLRS